MGQRLTQAQLARELGVSRQAIHKHVVAGTLAVGDDGKIDLDAARAAMQTLHPGAKTVQALGGSAPLAPAAEPAPSHVVIPPQSAQFLGDADENGMPTNYHIARTLREAEEARMARLKREEMEGQLIRIDAVRAAWSKRITSARDALLQIPHRLAPVLAAESDMESVAQLLEDELRNALADLSRGDTLTEVPS